MRTSGSVNKATLAFCEQYDRLAQSIADPVEVLFRLCKNRDPNIRERAASKLMNKRFASQLAIKPAGESQGELTFTWSQDAPDHANHDTVHASQESGETSQLN